MRNRCHSLPTKPDLTHSIVCLFVFYLEILFSTVSVSIVIRMFLLIAMGKYLTGETELGEEGGREG